MRSTALLTGRALNYSFKSPFYLLMALTQPLIWLFLFGSLFGPAMARLSGGGAGLSYIAYIAPGIAAMSAATGASYAGIQVLSDLQRGAMNRLFVSPASDLAIACSPLFYSGLISSVQATLLMTVGMIVSGDFIPPSAVAMTALVGLLLGIGFSGLSVTVALHYRKIQTIIGMMNFLNLPLVFLSSVLISHAAMPGWMKVIAFLNPIDWGASLNRFAVGAEMAEMAVLRNLALLCLFALTACTLSVHMLRRYRRSF